MAHYLFLLPFFAVFLVFGAYPLIQSLILSTQQTYGPKTSVNVGLDNFALVFSDPLFRRAVLNTIIYAGGSVLINIPVALSLALMVNQSWLRARPFFRLVFFSPSLVGTAFVAILFTPLFAKNTGMINILMSNLYESFNPEFAWTEQYVLTSLIIVSFWMYVGFNMIFFLAALQNLDQSLIDAAVVDGASPLERFRHVIFPAIRPVTAFVVLTSIIGSVQIFEIPYILLNFSGGVNNRGLTIVSYLYQVAFEFGDLGYASAIGWFLSVILIFLVVIQRLFIRRFES